MKHMDDKYNREFTKVHYDYNLILNLNKGTYSLIVGTGRNHFVKIFQGTDDYSVAFDKQLAYVAPEWTEDFKNIAGLEQLRGMRAQKGSVRSLEYASIVDDRTAWHEIKVFMGTNEHGEDIANLLGRDITKAHEQADTRTQTEIVQGSNDAKTRFLSNVSYDIRTPINGIMGMLHIAQKHRDDEKRVDDCLKKIEASANYLLTLLNDILDIDNLENGTAIVEDNPFNMKELLQDIYNIIQPSAHMSGIALEMKCEEFLHPDVIGSTLHLRQILMNLISNSIKYSKKEGTVYIDVTELEENDNTVSYQFVIRDNGIGMSEEFQQKMFEVFEQEYSGGRTTHTGAGLGLAVVKMLVDLLGGELSVQSEKEKGSTFSVRLPFKINHNPVPSNYAEVIESADCLKDTRILIVEDNEFNMEIAKVVLEEAGAVTTLAENGRVAVDVFEKSPVHFFDVILMDIMMPEMDGLKATKVIRAMNREDAKKIPIIAMTANAFAEDIKKSVEAGMDEHIAKPLDMALLAMVIAKHIK